MNGNGKSPPPRCFVWVETNVAEALGYLNVNSRANFKTRGAICDHCSLRIDKIET
jgi:hypothetical protein